jgi:hypothetical protein
MSLGSRRGRLVQIRSLRHVPGGSDLRIVRPAQPRDGPSRHKPGDGPSRRKQGLPMLSYGCGQKLDSGLAYAAPGRRIIPVAPTEAGTQRFPSFRRKREANDFPSFPRKREPSGVRHPWRDVRKDTGIGFRTCLRGIGMTHHRRRSRGSGNQWRWCGDRNDSQDTGSPRCAWGPSPGGSQRGLFYPLTRSICRASAADVDS